MKVLCFDIGGTDIKYGVIENEVFLLKGSIPTNYALGQESISNRIIDLTRELMKKHTFDGVGISCAGCVDFDYGKIIVGPENIKEFDGWDFEQLFMENFGLKVVADNDVNCFGVAEGTSGAAKKFSNYLTMTVGTGIGGAIVIHGEMWRGLNFKASEFGRMLLEGGRYENLASVTALIRMARLKGLKVGSGLDVFNLYDQKDPTAIEVVTTFYHNLALGIANLTYIFNPEAIVIGGGISNRKSFSTELKRELKKIMVPSFYETVKIFNAQYQNDGGMMGAYYNFVSVYR